MKFSVAKDKIYPVIQNALSFTTNKNLSTVLQNIYIESEANQVTVKSTNFQTGFSAKIDANVIENGATTVSAKKLCDIVRELNDNDEIDFVYDNSRLHIKSGKSSFQLATMDAELFPKNVTILPEYSFKADGEMLLSLFKKIAFCISNDITKLEYNGAHMNIFADTIEISSADYQRIATTSKVFEGTFSDEFLVNIPKKTVMDLIKIFDGANEIQVETDKRQIIFKSSNLTITSKLIEKYIRGITKLFSVAYSINAKVKKDILSEVVKRISSITSEITHGVLLSFKQGELTVSSLETEYGQGEEVIDNIELTGSDIDIIFNSKHLLEILAYSNSEFVTFAMNTKISPALILPDNAEAKYLLVPIAIENIT